MKFTNPVKIKYYTKIYSHINKLREFKFSPNPTLTLTTLDNLYHTKEYNDILQGQLNYNIQL